MSPTILALLPRNRSYSVHFNPVNFIFLNFEVVKRIDTSFDGVSLFVKPYFPTSSGLNFFLRHVSKLIDAHCEGYPWNRVVIHNELVISLEIFEPLCNLILGGVSSAKLSYELDKLLLDFNF